MLTGCKRCRTASRDPLSIVGDSLGFGLWALGLGLRATGYGHAHDFDARHGFFTFQRNGLDLLDHIHAGHDAAEDRVLTIKRWRGSQHDEERGAPARHVVAESGHRHDTAIVRSRVELRLQITDECLLLLVERLTSHRHVATLNHKALDDAMEGRAVVDAGRREAQELTHMIRRTIWKELERDVAHRGLDYRSRGRELLDGLGRIGLGHRRWFLADRHRFDLDA